MLSNACMTSGVQAHAAQWFLFAADQHCIGNISESCAATRLTAADTWSMPRR